MRAEPADVHLPHVVLGLAVHDPVGHHLADAPGTGDPVRAEPGGDEEPSDVGLAQDELAVRCERLRAVDHRHDLGGLQHRNEPERVLGERLEPLPVVGQELMVEVGGRAVVHGPRGRVAFVAPHDQAAAGLPAEVHEPVRVAHRRQVHASAWNGLGQQVLVRERDDGHLHAGQPADLVRVHPAGVHDDVGRDRTVFVGAHASHAAVDDVDPRDPGVRPDLGTASARALGERERQVGRVQVPVGRDERRALHTARVEQREPRERVVGGDDLQRQAERVSPAFLATELLHAFVRRREAERPDLVPSGIDAGLGREAPVQLGAVHHHPREGDARAELSDQSGRVERGARRQLAAVDQQHVLPSELGQVVGDAGAGDASADHDRAVAVSHRGRAPRRPPSATCRTARPTRWPDSARSAARRSPRSRSRASRSPAAPRPTWPRGSRT